MQEKTFKHVPTAAELFERIRNNKANVSKHPWKDWGISKGEWVKYLQDRIRKDIAAPKEGNIAPDFAVERLSTDGKRTGETVNLSTLFEKPVALLFGSYT